MPHGPHDAHKAKPRSWMVMPNRVRTIARPPTVGSPPPRSARLGITTSTGRLASISSTPTPPDLQSDSPPPTAPLHTTHMTRTVILDGNAPSRPDYRTVAHSGFAASTASAPIPLRTSPPPRSARLGSTVSTGRLASNSSTPTPPRPSVGSPAAYGALTSYSTGP